MHPPRGVYHVGQEVVLGLGVVDQRRRPLALVLGIQNLLVLTDTHCGN